MEDTSCRPEEKHRSKAIGGVTGGGQSELTQLIIFKRRFCWGAGAQRRPPPGVEVTDAAPGSAWAALRRDARPGDIKRAEGTAEGSPARGLNPLPGAACTPMAVVLIPPKAERKHRLNIILPLEPSLPSTWPLMREGPLQAAAHFTVAGGALFPNCLTVHGTLDVTDLARRSDEAASKKKRENNHTRRFRKKKAGDGVSAAWGLNHIKGREPGAFDERRAWV